MALIQKLSYHLGNLKDARFRSFYMQRRVQTLSARERRSDAIAARLPRFNGPSSPEAERASADLRQQGYAMLSDIVPVGAVAELRDYFTNRPVKDANRPEIPAFLPPDGAPHGTHVAFFTNEEVAKAPRIYDIVNHPAVLATVAKTLGGMPTIGYMAAWWSLPAHDGKAVQAENYHRDVDDWRFLKLFVYLTDVDENSGPHIYVPRSHMSDKLSAIRRYTEQEVYDVFGSDCEKRFTGPAGTAFLENTYGFHRGYPVKSKPRLILQATYCIQSVPYGPKHPVATIGEGVPKGIDPYVNRVYCKPS